MIRIQSQNVSQQARLSEMPWIAPTASVYESAFGVYTEIMDHALVYESVIGDYSYVCPNCNIVCTDAGKFSNIASQVRVNPGSHPMDRPTLHHFTYRGEKYGFAETEDKAFFNWRRIQRVTIGHDTWIGHAAIIMPGITIGNGAIVGSHSVVTRDVPPYVIVAGSPAKPIRRRFPQMIADRLEQSAWWDWDHDTIRERFDDFKDIRAFLAKHC